MDAKLTEFDWRQRFESLLEQSSHSNDEEGPPDSLRRAAHLLSLRESPEDLVLRLYEEAIAQDVVEPFLDETYFLFRKPELWEAVEELFYDESVPESLIGKVVLFGLKQPQRAADFVDPDSQLQQLVSDSVEAINDWSSLQHRVRSNDSDLGEWYLADLAMAIGEPVKEIDVLRTLRRRASDPHSRARLRVLYRLEQNWRMYIELLKEEVDQLDDDETDARLDRLEVIVDIYRDEMDHDMMVVSTYRDILEIEPNHLEAIDALIERYEQMGRASDLVEMLERKVDLVDETAEKVDLLAQIGRLKLDKFHNQPEAIEAFERVLEMEPTHEGAFEFLKKMYEKRRRWSDLVELAEREVERLEDGAKKLQAIKPVAEKVQRRIPEQAQSLWEKVLEIKPTDTDAMEALDGLYERTESFEDLVDILEKRVSESESPEQMCALYRRVGRVYANRLDEAQKAVDAWHKALDLEPDEQTQRDLERLYIELEDWDGLESFYTNFRDREAFVRKLETLAGSLSDPETKIFLFRKAADIWRNEFDEPRRAEQLLRRILEVDETQKDIALKLESFYREQGDFRKLRDIYEILAEQADSEEESFGYRQNLADIYADQLGNKSRAFSLFSELFAEKPGEEGVRDALFRLAGQQNRWEELQQLLSEQLERTDLEEGASKEIETELARLYADQLSEPSKALDILERLEETERTLGVREKIHREAQDYSRLRDVLGQKLEFVSDPSSRADIFSEIGDIEVKELDSPEAALSAYQKTLGEEPDRVTVFDKAKKLFERTGQYKRLRDFLESEVSRLQKKEMSPDRERLISLYAELGDLYENIFEEYDVAIEHYSELLALDPHRDEAVEALEGFLEHSDELALRATEGLRPTFREREDWERLAELHEFITECSDDQGEIRESLQSLVEIRRNKLDDWPSAIDSLKALLRIDPEPAELRGKLYDLISKTGDWRELAEFYEKLLSEVDQQQLQADLLRELAELYEEHIDDTAQLEGVLDRLVDLEPQNAEALFRLGDILEQQQRWSELADIDEMKVDAVDDSQLEYSTRIEASDLIYEQLDEPMRSIEMIEPLYDGAASPDEVLERLENRLRETKQWEMLSDVLRARIETENILEEEQRALEYASILDQQLDDSLPATEVYWNILQEDPYHDKAMEGILSVIVETQQLEMIEELESLLEKTSQFDELFELLSKKASLLSDEAAIELYDRMSRIANEQLDAPQKAFDVKLKIFEAKPKVSFVSELESLADTSEQYEKLGNTLVSASGRLSDRSKGAELLWEASDILLKEADSPELAEEALTQLKSIEPERFEVLERLEDIYRTLQDWKALADILEQQLELTEDVEKRKERLNQLGTLYREVIERPGEAVRFYEQLLTITSNEAPVIRELEDIYRKLDHWSKLKELYERQLDADSGEKRDELLFKLGELEELKLKRPPKAISYFETLLQDQPHSQKLLDRLQKLYRKTENWEQLYEILERQIELVSDDEEKANVELEAAEILHRRLGSEQEAFDIYTRIFDADLGFESELEEPLLELADTDERAGRVVELLDPLYRQKEQWEALLELYEEVEPLFGESRRLELTQKMSQLREQELNRPDEAFRDWERALYDFPANEQIWDELERLAFETENFHDLLSIWEKTAAELNESRKRAQLCCRMGQLQREALENTDQAIDWYERALESQPGFETALLALTDIYESNAQWSELTAILRQRIEQTEEPQKRSSLELQLATLYREVLGEPQRALHIYTELLEENPGSSEALNALKQMYVMGILADQIRPFLKDFFFENDRVSELIELYGERIEETDKPEELADLWESTGDLISNHYEEQGRILEAYGEAFAHRPSDSNLYEKFQHWIRDDEHLEYYEQILQRALHFDGLDEANREQLLLDLADLQLNKLDEKESARRTFQKVLESNAENEKALRALADIHSDEKRFEELADILDKRISVTDEPDKIVELSLDLGQIAADHLQDLDVALESYRRVLEYEPANTDAYEAIEDIYRGEEAWEPLSRTLQEHLVVEEDLDKQIELSVNLAELFEAKLNNDEEAVETWWDVLELESQNQKALSALREVYAEREDWRNLAEVLERQLEAADDSQLELYEMLGEIYWDYLQDSDQAVDLWERALSFDDEYLPALRSLKHILEETGRFEQLSEVLEALIQHSDVDEEQMLGYRRQLGRLYTDSLGDLESASEVWSQVLDNNPADEEALESHVQIYRRQNHWDKVLEILEQKAEIAEEDSEKIPFLMQIGNIELEQLEQRDRSIETYERVLALDPSHLEASYALEDIYSESRETDDADELVDLYLSRAEQLEPEAAERQCALESAAELFEQQFDQPERALIVLLSALNSVTLSDQQLREWIISLAGEVDMYADVTDRYDEVLSETELNAESAECHRMVADLYLDRLNLAESAKGHLERALEFDEDDLELIEKLEDVYRDIDAFGDLADLMQYHIDCIDDPERQKELLRELGSIYYHQLEAIEEAVGAYRQIMDIEPTDLEAIESLEEIYMAQDRWRDLIALLDSKIEFTYEPDDVLAIKHRQGRLWEDRVGEVEEAIRVYREALDVDSTHEKSLDALERIFEEEQRPADLIDVYHKRIAATNDTESQVELYLKIASTQEEAFDQTTEAVSAYNDALMIDSENEEAIENLERIYLNTEEWSELVDILKHHTDVVSDTDKCRDLFNTLGEIYEEELDNAGGAFDACRESLQIEPEQIDVLRRGVRVAEQLEAWEQASEWYGELADLEELQRQADLQFRLGQILSQKLGRIDEAEEAFRRALYIEDFDHEEAFDALCELYRDRGEYKELVDVFKSAAGQTSDDEERARLYARIGKVYEHDIDDDVSAYSYYEDAIEENPVVIGRAGPPLIEMYKEEQRWEMAIPLLERYIERKEQTEDLDARRLRDRHLELAEMYEKLEQTDDAIDAYRAAYEIDPNSLEILQGLSRILFERKEYQKAKAIHRKIEDDYLDQLDNDSVVELYYRLGELHRELGEDSAAISYFEDALEIDGYFRPALERLIEVGQSQERYEDVVEYKRRIVEIEDDPVEQFAHLSDIGDIQSNKLDNPREAIRVYREALDIKPESAVVLSHLLQLYKNIDQWIDAIEIIERLIDLEDSAKKRAKYHYTIAVLFRDEIGENEGAVEHFQETLREDPTQLKAFEAIARILTERKDWNRLEESYRKMLQRLVEESDEAHRGLRANLWSNLGEIYRSRLEDYDAAIEAFETAVELGQDNEENHSILAQLYERTGTNTEGMIEHHRAILEKEPFRIESYQALFKAYLNTDDHDRAWCMAAALSFLDKADQQQTEFYQNHKPDQLRRPSRPLKKEALKRLYHSKIDTHVSQIINILGQGLRGFYSQDLRAWDIDPKEAQLDVESDVLFCRLFKGISKILQIAPPPDVYLNRTKPFGLKNANPASPSVIAGADVVQGKEQRSLGFLIAHQLCWMRPEYYLGSIGYPTEFLKLLFMSVMHLTDPNLGIEKRLGSKGDRVLSEIEGLPGHMQTRLTKRMEEFLEKGKNPNLTEWKRYVELTANRFGLLFVGDIQDAVYFLKNEIDPIGKASLKDKIKDLVLFSVSDEYFELRQDLELTIED